MKYLDIHVVTFQNQLISHITVRDQKTSPSLHNVWEDWYDHGHSEGKHLMYRLANVTSVSSWTSTQSEPMTKEEADEMRKELIKEHRIQGIHNVNWNNNPKIKEAIHSAFLSRYSK